MRDGSVHHVKVCTMLSLSYLLPGSLSRVFPDEFLDTYYTKGAIPGLGALSAAERYGPIVLNAMDGAAADRRAWHIRRVLAPPFEVLNYLLHCDGLRVIIGPYNMANVVDARHKFKNVRKALISKHGIQIGAIVFGPSHVCALGAAILGVDGTHSVLRALVLEGDQMHVPAAVSILWMLTAAANVPDSKLKLDGLEAAPRVSAYLASLDTHTAAALRLLGIWADALLALLDVTSDLPSVLRSVTRG